jgi:hypothetical protein
MINGSFIIEILPPLKIICICHIIRIYILVHFILVEARKEEPTTKRALALFLVLLCLLSSS